MYLIADSIIALTGLDDGQGYITAYEVKVRVSGSAEQFAKSGLSLPFELDDEQENRIAFAGKATVDRLHVGLIDEHDESVYDVCDAHSSTWEAVFAAFLTTEDYPRFYQALPGLDECFDRDVLLIHDISLAVEYKNRGLEMAVANRIIETIGAGCDLAVYYFGANIDELKALEPMCFEKGPVEGYAFLNLNYKHPAIKEVGFCKFAAAETVVVPKGAPIGSA